MKEKQNHSESWHEEADYFADDRKVKKQQRKLASSTDRSKYKKTDQDKIKQRLIDSSAIPNDQLLRGRVISIGSKGYLVDYLGKKLLCSLRGSLKKEKTQMKNLVAVGDWVLFERLTDEEGCIVTVEARKTILSRADNLNQRKEQLIAVNVDQVLITTSVVSPSLKLPLIDRYIIATCKGGMDPVIIVNKIDLLESDEEAILEEAALFMEFMEAYTKIGIPVIPLSADKNIGLDLLAEVMKDKVSVFSGQSGVGKSSLINAITGLSFKVSDVVDRTQKGSHTTSTANLVPLPFGGWCIDTPGIKSFGIWDLKAEEIEGYFDEIHSEGSGCKFPNCTHTHELDCAVLKAVENGKISPLRYTSYQTLLESVSRGHLRR